MRKIFVLSLLIFMQLAFAKQSFDIQEAGKTPVIDGKISAGEWDSATWFNQFYQTSPGDNADPSEKTEIAISYDKKNLYLMAKVYFADKNRQRNFHGSRDKIYTSDRVYFYFDTFGSNNQAYYLGCNAYGEQADGLTRKDGDPSIDLYYISQAVMTDYGFSLEIQVPLKSLNYKSGDDVKWGFYFVRHIPDGGESISSFPVDREGGSFFNNYAEIYFEHLPEKRNLKLIPSAVYVNSYDKDNKKDEKKTGSDFQPELNIFFEPNSHITATATINPDFNIVEADGVEIDLNNRFPSWYSEKRPFFIEERNPFGTDLNIFHTRNIVNPKWGGKISGNYGKNSFFALAAEDEDSEGGRFSRVWEGQQDETYFGFANYKRQLGEGDSFIRTAGTIRSFNSYENYVGSIDSFWRFSDNLTHELQFVVSGNETEDKVEIDSTSFYEDKYETGFAYSSDLDFNTENYYLECEQSGVSKDFQADLGFMHDNDYQFTGTRIEYHRNSKREEELFHYFELATTQNFKYDYEFDNLIELYWETMLGFNTRENINVWTGFERSMTYWYNQDNWNWYYWLSLEYFPIKELGASCLLVTGKGLYLWGNEANPQPFHKFEPKLFIRPFDQLDIELIYRRHELEEYYIAETLEANAKIQFHKNFWFRAIVQYRDTEGIYTGENEKSLAVYPLFTFKPNSRTSFYLGSSFDDGNGVQWEQIGESENNWELLDFDKTGATLFAKISYTFDLL